jgi:hypothetical protein
MNVSDFGNKIKFNYRNIDQRFFNPLVNGLSSIITKITNLLKREATVLTKRF